MGRHILRVGATKLKRLGIVVMMILLLVYPVAAAEYGPVSYESSGVRVTVEMNGPDSWVSPYDETIHAEITVAPLQEDVTEINVTKITLMIYSLLGEDNVELLAGDFVTFDPALTGTSSVNSSVDFHVTGSGTGASCYYAFSVVGTYSNSTDTISFNALSSSTFIGPFGILRSLTSPVSVVGVVVLVLSGICVAAGMYGVKKAKGPAPRRKTLLDE